MLPSHEAKGNNNLPVRAPKKNKGIKLPEGILLVKANKCNTNRHIITIPNRRDDLSRDPKSPLKSCFTSSFYSPKVEYE